MSVEYNKNLIRKYIEEVVNTGNVNEIEKYVSSNYTEIHEGKRHVVGIEGAKEHIIGVRTTYPDLKLTVDLQIAEGDWVATCITARGTHKGRWIGIKPTNKRVTFTGVNIEKIENGKITEHGGAANILFQLLEIGAIKVVGGKE
ncbi:MAG: ester cyclase [Spirochaetes bacterium]|jgi:predicted ester cyclase|nr:ester cyclase [Spirochaetota bacterium]